LLDTRHGTQQVIVVASAVGRGFSRSAVKIPTKEVAIVLAELNFLDAISVGSLLWGG